MICIYYLITRYYKFSILLDLYESLCNYNTDLKHENLIKWVFVKVFENQNILKELLESEFWIVINYITNFNEIGSYKHYR